MASIANSGYRIRYPLGAVATCRRFPIARRSSSRRSPRSLHVRGSHSSGGSGRQVAEAGVLGFEEQLDGADGAVAVLGDDDFGDAAVGGFGVVVLVAVDHHHDVCVLLDRAGFAQVAEHRPLVGAGLHLSLIHI